MNQAEVAKSIEDAMAFLSQAIHEAKGEDLLKVLRDADSLLEEALDIIEGEQ